MAANGAENDLTEDTCIASIYKRSLYSIFSDYEVRITTFIRWPYQQNILLLAKAGFFYVGCSDYVICFSCGLELMKWHHRDIDPFQEHIAQYDECPYLSEKKIERYENYIARTIVVKLSTPQYYIDIFSNAIKSLEKEKNTLSYILKKLDRFTDNKLNDIEFRQRRLLENFLTLKRSCLFMTGDNFNPCFLTDISENSFIPAEYVMAKKNSQDEENLGEKNTTCCLCLSNIIKILFLPCNHLLCCIQCANKLTKCPICQSEIWMKIEVIISGSPCS